MLLLSQVGLAKGHGFESEARHCVFFMIILLLCCAFCSVYVFLHVHDHYTHYTPFQHSLPETRVHYCSLTSASSLVSIPATLFVFAATELCVCCVRWDYEMRAWPLWECCLWCCPSKLSNVCVCVCALSSAGDISVVLFVLKGLSPQWPQRRLSIRETQRERKRESAFAVPSHPHIILISGNFSSFQSCFQLVLSYCSLFFHLQH